MDALQVGVSIVGPVITAALVIVANAKKSGKSEATIETKIQAGFEALHSNVSDIKNDVKDLKKDWRDTSEKLAERLNITEIKVAEIQGQLYGHARGAAEAAMLKIRGSNTRQE